LPSSARAKLLLRSTLALLGAVLTLGAWLYASPPGSSPDDGYHLGSIWCAGGYEADRCIEIPGSADPDAALVPAALGQLTCVAGDGRLSAACQNDLYARLDGQFAGTPANLSGVRATLYYRAANMLISDDLPAAIARIRVANAALVLVLVGLTAFLAAPDVRRAVLGAWLVASLPHGIFLVTSLNSTAWGLVGLGTMWANTLTALRPAETWRRVSAAVLAITGATMGLGSRTEAAAHLGVILIAIFALWTTDIRRTRFARPSGRRSVLLASVLALSSIAFLTFILQQSAVGYLLRSGFGLSNGWDRLVQRGISNPALTLAAESPQLWTGALGTWSLGWLDTNMPSTVSVSATVAFSTLAAFGLIGASRGRSSAALIIFAAMVLLPVLSLLSVGLVVLESLQPRHYLPLLYVLLGLSLVRSPRQPDLVLSRGTRTALTTALTTGHAIALVINIRRYTTGLTEFLYIDMNRPVEWWWGGLAPSPEAIWALGSLGYGLLAYSVLASFSSRGLHTTTTSQPTGAP
jgi:hypothetical protein